METELEKQWKEAMAKLAKAWKSWMVSMKPFLQESERRARAFGIGIAKGEDGREEVEEMALIEGNTDNDGELQAFSMGLAVAPLLRKKLWSLIAEAVAGVKIAGWLRPVLVAMLEAIIPRE